MRTLKEQLKDWKKQAQDVKKKKKRKGKRKKQEQLQQEERLTRRDIEDLMGIRGPRYGRHRGALRQK